MTTTKQSKDEKNMMAVLEKLSEMPEHVRSTMKRMHEVILEANPDLKPRIWYGMPGYAQSNSTPVLVFFRNDDVMTLGVSEKANLKPAGGRDGLLIPSAWYFEDLDETTEKRVADIVRQATM